jgi:hypothetical protein
MPTQEEILQHRKLLAMYRDLLAEYLRQQKLWDRTEIPAFLSTGISVIRGHIKNTKGTLRGWKVEIADQPDDEGPDDDLASEVAHQRGLLKIQRANVKIYLRQLEQFGPAQAPATVIHSLRHSRSELRRIKAILRGWNIAVDDLPEELDDEEQ